MMNTFDQISNVVRHIESLHRRVRREHFILELQFMRDQRLYRHGDGIVFVDKADEDSRHFKARRARIRAFAASVYFALYPGLKPRNRWLRQTGTPEFQTETLRSPHARDRRDVDL